MTRRFRTWLAGRHSPARLQPPPWGGIDKRDAPCCRAKVDDLGRFLPGYCGPECVRRPAKRGA